jgi:hypothetical protein
MTTTSGPHCISAGVFTVIKPVDEFTTRFAFADAFVDEIS